MKTPMQWMLKGWHYGIAPMFPPMCRFSPSCSTYAVEALQKHRLPRATVLIVKRVARCNPMCAGGFDPVPEPEPRQIQDR